MAALDDQRRAAGLKPLPNAAPAEVKQERGHGRGKTQVADKTDIGLRGFPVIGHGSGAISGTAPGGEIGAAARLERAGREIVRSHMQAARKRLKQGPERV